MDGRTDIEGCRVACPQLILVLLSGIASFFVTPIWVKMNKRIDSYAITLVSSLNCLIQIKNLNT